MSWFLIETELVSAEKADFIRATDIWIDKPHTVNKRLCAGTVVWKNAVKIVSFDDLAARMVKIQSEVTDFSNCHEVQKQLQSALNELISIEDVTVPLIDIVIQLTKLLPKHVGKYDPVLLVTCTDEFGGNVLSIPLIDEKTVGILTPPYASKLCFESTDVGHKMSLWVYDPRLSRDNVKNEPGIDWMKCTLFYRIKKWAESTPIQSSVSSLQLVAADKYSLLYQQLKIKYGHNLVKNWPEKTDPSKFVYEDVAIAAYLLILWEEERETKRLTNKQSFVDLGCGNGLLVYLLTSEGHPGFGLDVRKRNIWETCFPHVKLEETSIVPSSETIYPDCDWLIGNHSDELTPWIPVMAARSSYNTRFFLLPCCAHDFDRTYQRTGSSLSQYQSYLKYVEKVATICGFDVKVDKLRIPSTKRICFVGMNRNYPEDDEEEADRKRREFITERCSNTKSSAEAHEGCSNLTQSDCNSSDRLPDVWAEAFTVRNAVEPVRNCTQLDKRQLKEIVATIAKSLLQVEQTIIMVETEMGGQKEWNLGGRLSLPLLAEVVGKEKLGLLKSQCGGLQTLLRNHKHIFEVCSGQVSLRNYTRPVLTSSKRKRAKLAPTPIKHKPCWFYSNHPNGCVLFADSCTYLHIKVD